MAIPLVLHLPGNGFHPVRLERARAALAGAGGPFELEAWEYPPAGDFEALLEALAQRAAERRPGLLVATGIGALVALAARARGDLAGLPIVSQGAVLWGLEQRLFPRCMRAPGAARLLAAAFGNRAVQRRFARRHFLVPPDARFLERFFEGYRDAEAFARWFRWLDARLLRRLEQAFAAHPERLDAVRFWWGERDRVVGPRELTLTEAALGRRLPLRRFAEWGHYPMIDDPDGWVREVQRELESAPAIR